MLGFVVCSFFSGVCVVVVVSLGCKFGWVVVGWALGGASFMLARVVSFLMMLSMWLSTSPVRVYRRYSRESV